MVDDAPVYITGAMIIGAALGAGVAIALRGNPIAGALSGAMIAGGGTAATVYINYRLEQANGNHLRMVAAVRNDVDRDQNLAAITLSDLELSISEIKTALQGISSELSKNADIAIEALRVARNATLNGKTFQKACKMYQEVLPRCGLNGDTDVQEKVGNMGICGQRIIGGADLIRQWHLAPDFSMAPLGTDRKS